jgi:hypothetical protein
VSYDISDSDLPVIVDNTTIDYNLTVSIDGNEIVNSIKVYKDKGSYQGTMTKLQYHYPINSTEHCFYNKKHPLQVQLNKNNPAIYLAFFIVFLVLGCCCLLFWLMCEVVGHGYLFAQSLDDSSSYY